MKKYRPNAGIVVFRDDKKVLMCHRLNQKTDGWQFPQGGIEDGESPQQAALRELEEETSITSVEVIKTLNTPLRYDFPADIKQKFAALGIMTDGQEQYWNLCYFYGSDSEINLKTQEQEFDKFGWFDLSQAVNMVWEAKKEVYEKMVAEFLPLVNFFRK